MKNIIIIVMLIFSAISNQCRSQDVFGRQNGNRIQLIYIEKITTPDTLLTEDSVFHYNGSQGGTVVYNPYGMLAARLVSNVLGGRFRVEFGGGIGRQQEGWLPYFMTSSGGLMTVVQSNSTKCDCTGEAEKILTQIDIQMYNRNPAIPDPDNYLTMGCTFTVFMYWISDI